MLMPIPMNILPLVANCFWPSAYVDDLHDFRDSNQPPLLQRLFPAKRQEHAECIFIFSTKQQRAGASEWLVEKVEHLAFELMDQARDPRRVTDNLHPPEDQKTQLQLLVLLFLHWMCAKADVHTIIAWSARLYISTNFLWVWAGFFLPLSV